MTTIYYQRQPNGHYAYWMVIDGIRLPVTKQWVMAQLQVNAITLEKVQ